MELIKALRNFTICEVEALERAILGQNSNENWKLQRTGRITASVSQYVITKVQSLNTPFRRSRRHIPSGANPAWLLRNLLMADTETGSVIRVCCKLGRFRY